jgi:hypothetical protein
MSADAGHFLELGWRLPHNVLDLYVEHRVETNGEKVSCGDGLLGALAMRGLSHIDAGEKDAMRRLICEQRHWTEEEQQARFKAVAQIAALNASGEDSSMVLSGFRLVFAASFRFRHSAALTPSAWGACAERIPMWRFLLN